MTILLILAALFFAATFATGYLLRRAGRPYGAGRFNLHKFIALGGLAYLAVSLNRARMAEPFTPAVVGLLAAAGAFYLGAVVTGGIVSAPLALPGAAKPLHRALPYLALLATAAALVLLASG